MPLLMLDLDNTLVDRDAAFRSALAEFLTDHGLPPTDVSWLTALDGDGYTPRAEVAAAMTARYGPRVPARAIHAVLDHGAADRVALPPLTRAALVRAREAGLTPLVVTNGRTAQQTEKLRRTGLTALVDGWAISEAVGHRKPDPGIFHAAAAGRSLHDAWMIGDAPRADIGGAQALGLRTVWVTRGRTWREPDFAPTLTADDVVEAIDAVLRAQP
ncbi:HAD family hydrolase [Streptomyces sp. Q6]|uniref:HAD family hydrolase n=1 Tax=Streptomyces citrinus TaxID=3118173 RepID=A0ACD5AKT5_9ACTN